MRTLAGKSRVILVAWVAGMLAGCVGPAAMQSARTEYNKAIQDTSNEQLLLNLVRLRYRENMTFLEVKQVTANYALKLSATPAWATAKTDTDSTRTLTLVGEYTENPSITYDPIQGEQFAKRIISDIDRATMFTMMKSGWHVDELLRLTVDRMGGCWNDPRMLCSADDETCSFRKFRKICSCLRTLQDHHALDLSEESKGNMAITIPKDNPDAVLKAEKQGFYLVTEEPTDDKEKSTDGNYVMKKNDTSFLTIAISYDSNDLDSKAAAALLFETLLGGKGEPPSDWKLRLTIPSSGGPAKLAVAPNIYDVPIKLRSFETIMYLLSQGIPVPESDARCVKAHYYFGVPSEDRVPDTEIPWAKAVGLINVKCSSTRPAHPYVAVRYHNAWFYIDQAQSERIGKATVESKDTLTMLSYIYSLHSGEIQAAAPALTIPTK